MTTRKVNHAIFRYKVGDRIELAVRGTEIELTEDEAKRGDELGALVPVDMDLATNGELLALSEAASDEEIKSYLANGKVSEIEEQAKDLSPSVIIRMVELEEESAKPRKTLVEKLMAISDAIDATQP